MTVGEKLKKERKARGLTQQLLADSAGISRSAYAHYEANDVEMSVSIAKKIGKVLKCNWYTFFE